MAIFSFKYFVFEKSLYTCGICFFCHWVINATVINANISALVFSQNHLVVFVAWRENKICSFSVFREVREKIFQLLHFSVFYIVFSFVNIFTILKKGVIVKLLYVVNVFYSINWEVLSSVSKSVSHQPSIINIINNKVINASNNKLTYTDIYCIFCRIISFKNRENVSFYTEPTVWLDSLDVCNMCTRRYL